MFDVNVKKLLKSRDVVFYEDTLGHPSLRQYGLQPGFDILGNTIAENSLDIVEQGEDAQEVVLVTLKPSMTEIALVTPMSSAIPESDMEDIPGQLEVPVMDIVSDKT